MTSIPTSRTAARRRMSGLLLLVALLAGGACAPPGAGGGDARIADDLPPVILISFDTCRADVFGVLSGAEPSPTPHLDAFANDAVVFENAFVQAPHTLPSHMSMITSVYPDAHGVKPERGPLPPGFTTLPEVLQGAGYHTVGRVTSEWLKSDFGFGRGFDDYALLHHDFTYAGRVNDAALAQVPRRPRAGAPLFLFLHYYDLHSDFDHGSAANKFPYYAPPEQRRHLPVSDDGREFCDGAGHCNTRYLMAVDRERRELPRAKVEVIHDLYRAAVPHLDAQMGTFFDALRKRGLYGPALIVVTSDHGEEFREHGRFIHSQPYDETLRVPLFVKLPGGRHAGLRLTGLVETVDVMPTILDVLGLPAPDYVQGQSAMDLLDGGERADDAVASQDTINLTRYALRSAEIKLIMDLDTGRHELYDLRRDPGETENLAGARPEVTSAMEARLKRLIRTNRSLASEMASGTAEQAGDELLSPAEKERLEALGYVN